jgi:hypothetical protein
MEIGTAGSGDHTARLWVLKDPEAEPRVLRGHARWVTLAFDAQGRWLANQREGGQHRAPVGILGTPRPNRGCCAVRGVGRVPSPSTLRPLARHRGEHGQLRAPVSVKARASTSSGINRSTQRGRRDAQAGRIRQPRSG